MTAGRAAHYKNHAVVKTGSAGRPSLAPESIIGTRHGKLVAVEYLDKSAGQRRVVCKCDCGKTRLVRPTVLVSGVARCCGCSRKSIPRTEGDEPRGGLRVVTTFKKSSRQPTSEVRLAQSAKWVAACLSGVYFGQA